MTRILIVMVMHRPMASAIVAAVEFIHGGAVGALCAVDVDDVQSVEHECHRAVRDCGIGPDDRVVVFTDLEGSTPWRVATQLARECHAQQPHCNAHIGAVLTELEAMQAFG